MGDFRADIRIKMNLIGKYYKYDAWLNYFPDDNGIDRLISEWFKECWNDAKERHDKIIAKQWEKYHEKEIEDGEKSKLKRLKEKYESNQK